MVGNKSNSYTRRTAIKLAAATGVLGGFPIIGGANDQESEFEDHIRRSYELLRSGATHEARKRFLEARGLSVYETRHTFKMPAHADEVGTDSFDSNELDIRLNLIAGCAGGRYYAENVWEYDWDIGGGYGQKPNDRIGIGFETQWWAYSSSSVSDTTETSSLVQPNESEFGDGPAFEMNDASVDAEDGRHWAGVYLDPVGDYSSNERRVQGGYSHLWNGVTIENVSVGLPKGISVAVSNETNEWRTWTEQDNDTMLKAYQEDATDCW